jgi:prolyl oligopeptidase
MRVFLLFALLAAAVAAPPATQRKAVVDEYHGVRVTDDYRWLESWDDPAVRAWSDAQNAYARSVLDALPGVAAIRQRVAALRTIRIPSYSSLTSQAGLLFALKDEPPKQQVSLVVLKTEDAPEAASVVLDPNVLDPKGGAAIDWFVPSLDGKQVAVSLSEGGSEMGAVHVYETATGKPVGEVVPRVNGGTAGGSLAWDREGKGFYYTRYPRQGERPAADMDAYTQVYYHRLGTPSEQDRYETGKDFPRIAEIKLRTSPDGRYVLANVANGDGGQFAQHLRGEDGRWTPLTTFADQVALAVFGPDDSLYLLSRKDAPRGKVLKLSLAAGRAPSLAAAGVVVPESDAAIRYVFDGPDTVVVTQTRLLTLDQIGGPNQVRVFDFEGHALGRLPLSPLSSVSRVVALQGRSQETVLYETAGFLEPDTWYRHELTGPAPKSEKTALSRPFPVDFSDAEVVREEAVSKDGTRVPLTLVRRKGTALDGRNPVLLTAYGGYAISMSPRFDPGLRLWLDHGFVFALAHLRGGGEFGEEWHRAGKLTRKQNVFDDFIACAAQLVSSGYTRPDRLVIEGGSNGGLLMGAVLTQRPEMFKAVVSHVGIYDMLRWELSANGAFNVTEMGSVKDPAEFRALYAYSPYHHVANQKAYPAVLLMTGANDPRVEPLHSRKMAARLQAATHGRSLVLLRTSANTGHGMGSPLDARIEEEVDVVSFVFAQLGISAKGTP